MSICFSVNLEFDRYGDQNGMFEIFRFNESLPSLSLLGKLSPSSLKVSYYFIFLAKRGAILYLDGIRTKKLEAKYNLRSKWTSMCTSFDFPADNWQLFVNGKEIANLSTILRPLTGKMSDAKDLPMVVRLAHYYFDDKPIIGKIVDFNLWDR